MEETPGAELDSRSKVVNNNVFLKDNLDAFSSSDHKFEDFIAINKEIQEFYIIGLDAALCVNETARAAVKRGYNVSGATLFDKALTFPDNL